MPAASMFPKPLTGPISSIGAVKFTKIILHEVILALATVAAEYQSSVPKMLKSNKIKACMWHSSNCASAKPLTLMSCT